jgi:hypothetical protein
MTVLINQKTSFYNGATWHLMTRVKNFKNTCHLKNLGTQTSSLYSLCMCLQFSHNVYIGGHTKPMWCKLIIKITIKLLKEWVHLSLVHIPKNVCWCCQRLYQISYVSKSYIKIFFNVLKNENFTDRALIWKYC